MSSRLDEILTLAADLFQVPRSRVAAASSPDTVDGWDSVQHLNLVMAIEARFSVVFEPDEIAAMSDLGAVARILQRKLEGQGSKSVSSP
ncbi:MAG TPA: acyl carrier protein [Candidatus Polarisedimenticolia bacterium]|nr:acyl carrier protein [Candidatus Polarisedimenticolia bacterium]